MCRKIHSSASEKVVFYTLDPPYKKGDPGYVAAETPVYGGEVYFTRELWLAKAVSRDEVKTLLPSLKHRTKMDLHTHAAVALLYDPEVLKK